MKWRRSTVFVVLVGILSLLLAGGPGLAQDRPQSVVSTNVIGTMGLSRSFINLEYERAMSPGVSFYVAPGIGFGLGTTAFGVTAGIKKYFGKPAPEGFWVGGFGTFLTAGAMGYSATAFGGGANGGYKYFITDRFTVEGRLGGAYYIISGVGGWFDLAAGLNVGYAF